MFINICDFIADTIDICKYDGEEKKVTADFLNHEVGSIKVTKGIILFNVKCTI